ncbi:MAG: YggS family pyridoxal phosphate-dependent enzyme [Candidatus Gastranaerophilales bacterium]|nr:YggS family pyridoxal phosphate-dependent enzyme [Candidatus Gastranaerophilales bacterium]
MIEEIQKRLNIINTQLVPYNPKIIAVTKYFDESMIVRYYEAGLREFGENRVLEANEKISKLPEEIRKNSKFHLIGHLQTNKVKHAVGNFDLIHSVDSLKLAEAISNEALKKKVVQKILLQVNNANEESKYGFTTDEIKDCMDKLLVLPSIQIEGLMNIAPLSQDEDYLRNLFRGMKKLKDNLETEYKVKLKELSMGMSNDFRIAAEEGSTIIRLGRILFK